MTELPTTDCELIQFDQSANPIFLKLYNVLLDSGTSDVLIARSSLSETNFVTHKLPSELSLSNALSQDSGICINRAFYCNISFPKFSIQLVNIKVFIVEGQLAYACILGMTAMSKLKCDFRVQDSVILSNKLSPTSIVVNNTEVDHHENDYVVISGGYDGEKPHLLSKFLFCVGPYSETFLPVKTILVELFENNEELKLTTSENFFVNGLAVFPKFEKSRKLVKIKNLTGRSIIIESETLVGTLVSVKRENLLPDATFTKIANFLVKFENISDKEKEIHQNELKEWKSRRDNLCKHVDISGEIEAAVRSVDEEFKPRLRDVLVKNSWIFSRSSSDAGLNSHFLVDLVLKPGDDQVPVFSKPYKNDRTRHEKLSQKIEELKTGQIIEQCNSPWNSPIISVLKKDGKLRLVHNYSANLNQRLLTGHYPLVPMRDIFRSISQFVTHLKAKNGGKILFSNIDIRNGYYSLSIRENKRDLTSFIINHEQLRYRRLSQGLSCAPSTFSQYMAEVFLPLKKKGQLSGNFVIQSYLDDYIVASSEEVHFEILDMVFKCCLECNLVLGLEKCGFAKHEVEFLGFIIDANGFRAKKAKVETLINLPFPNSQSKAMSYMATMNFFSRSVPRLAFLLKPLTDGLRGKSKKFVLTDNMKNALTKLRENLRSGIGTTHLSYDDQVFLAVDSSLTATGFSVGNCVLENNQPKNITYSHFGSSNFDPVVQSLGSRNRELIGLSRALDTFSDIFPRSLSFVAFVDHESLCRVFQKQDLGISRLHTRVRKAYSIVLDFPNLEIMHLPAKSDLMGVVDGISRLSTGPASELSKAHLSPDIQVMTNNLKIERPIIEKQRVLSEQRKCPKILQIIQKMEDQTVCQITVKSKKYLLRDNMLYLVTDAGKPLLYIPQILAEDILGMYHIWTLHRGEKALHNALKNSGTYIENKSKLIHKVTSTCLYCQMANHSKFRKLPETEFKIKPAFGPYEKVSVDLLDISYGSSQTYLLTFYDLFSSYLDFEFLTSKTSQATSEALALLLVKHGCQYRTQLQSDNGLEFCSKTFETIMKELGIYHTKISPYNSRAARVERAHREIRFLLKIMDPDYSNFRTKVKMACHIYNNTPRESLNYESPNSILTGVDPPIPDFFNVSADSLADEEPSPERWINWRRQMQSRIALNKFDYYTTALRQIENPKFSVNDLVVVIDPVLRLSKTRSPGAKGPYLIEKINLSSLVLRHVITNSTLKRNCRHVRKLRLDENVAKMLKEHAFTLFESNRIRPLPKSITEIEDLILIEGELASDKDLSERRYNLRARNSK